MEFGKVIELPDSKGRLCEIHLSEAEFSQLLTIGAGALLNAGIVHIMEKAQLDGKVINILSETKGNA